MNSLVNIFSPRELASFFWIGIIFLFVLMNNSVRKSMIKLLKSLFSKQLVTIHLLLISYTLLIIIGLQRIGFWSTGLVKDTLLWLFGVGFVATFKAITIKSWKDYQKLLLDILKISMIFEFLIAFYTFNIWTELVLVPFITIIAILQVFSEKGQNTEKVNTFLKRILSVIGFGIMGFVIYKTFFEAGKLLTLNNLKVFTLPIILLIALTPLLYFISLWSIYESLFLRLNFFFKDKSLRKAIKRQVFRVGNLSISKMSNISKNIVQARPFEKNNSLEIIRRISKRDLRAT